MASWEGDSEEALCLWVKGRCRGHRQWRREASRGESAHTVPRQRRRICAVVRRHTGRRRLSWRTLRLRCEHLSPSRNTTSISCTTIHVSLHFLIIVINFLNRPPLFHILPIPSDARRNGETPGPPVPQASPTVVAAALRHCAPTPPPHWHPASATVALYVLANELK